MGVVLTVHGSTIDCTFCTVHSTTTPINSSQNLSLRWTLWLFLWMPGGSKHIPREFHLSQSSHLCLRRGRNSGSHGMLVPPPSLSDAWIPQLFLVLLWVHRFRGLFSWLPGWSRHIPRKFHSPHSSCLYLRRRRSVTVRFHCAQGPAPNPLICNTLWAAPGICRRSIWKVRTVFWGSF